MRSRKASGSRAAAEAERQARAEAEKKREAEGRKKPGRPAAPPSEDPDPKAQKNFTDPESRIMKTKDGFIQGYNAQAAVDAEAQVIVAHGLDANASDQHQLTPMVDAVEANMSRKPEQVSADAGYCSDANLEAMEERAIDAYIAPGHIMNRSLVFAAAMSAALAFAASAEAKVYDWSYTLTGGSTRAKDKAEARASPPCERKSRPADTQPPIDCASNCPSRCSGTSNRPVASVSS
jgi:hypothetical protein